MNYINHYTHIIIGLIILISVSLISCNPNFDPTLGTYTVSFETLEYGTAKASKTEVGYNGEVTLTATPQEGYRFVNWTVEGKEVSKENPYTALIIRNTQFRANFEKEIYTIKVTAGEGGTAKASKTEVGYNGQVTLTATPKEGYRFVNWTVEGKEVSKENPYRAIVKTSTQFRANFEKDNYKVSVKEAEGGSVKASQKGDVLNGTKVTFTATPQEGFSFISWIVNGNEASKENPYTITITENTEVQASFITHKVTVTASEGGTATASKTEVGHNGQVTLTATPQEGYSFVNWTVNGEEVSKANPYTATITANTEFKANFIITHKVTVISGGGGTATANKTQVAPNGQVTLTATPQEGYSFVNWTVNGEVVSTKNPYAATITANTEFVANFISYKVTVISDEGGTAKASKTQAGHNGQVTLTATPKEGYSFVNWTVNGEEVSTANPYTATITANTEFKANFKATKGVENSHEWIDLGLPSGLKWATCNVGADTPEGYGDYFAWGETSPKTTYKWSTYKYCNGFYDTMTKYCTKSSYGTVDNKTTLELSDDAARVNWGGNWRMPTKAEQKELRNTSNCTWIWTTQNGVNGYKVTSKKNGNSIFLPAVGYRYYDGLYVAGDDGGYWSSSLDTNDSYGAYGLGFDSSCVDGYGYGRCDGRSVRAVCE